MARATIIIILAGLVAGARPVPAGGADPETRCRALREKLWRATLPARQLLGVDNEQQLWRRYGEEENFLDRCRQLAPRQLSCLEEQEHPLGAFSRCLGQEGVRRSEVLRAPTLLGLLDQPDEEEREYPLKQLTRWLQGSWRNRWPDGRSQVYWRVNPRGRIAETRLGPDGVEAQRHLIIMSAAPGRLVVDAGEGRQERWPWLRLGPRHMIVGRHLPHAVMAPVADGRARLRYGNLLLLVEPEQCRVISNAGSAAPAECRWEAAKPWRRCLTSWKHPETEVAGQASFYLMGEYLVEEKLVRSGWFEKK